MSCYVSSNENRLYAAIETNFGIAATISEADRMPVVKFSAQQVVEQPKRHDKTGSRTFPGTPAGTRKKTSFDYSTYLTSWPVTSSAPAAGPLIQSAMGGVPVLFTGGTVASITGTQLQFTAAHNLAVGQGVSCGGEMRFVAAIVDSLTVLLNAPLTGDQAAGWPVDRAITYRLGGELPSLSIFDYWSPATAVQRLLNGAVVDQMKVSVNGDFHGLAFSGFAKDLIDSASFEAGAGGLAQYPPEPTVAELSYSVVPGNLGQAWLGTLPDQFFTLTEAELLLENGLDMRDREFGSDTPLCAAPGDRSVSVNFSLFEKPDVATTSLYQASRQRSPISVMLQLGQQTAQLCGLYLMSVTPEVPDFADDTEQLEWRFVNCRAQGTLDDEIFVSFG